MIHYRIKILIMAMLLVFIVNNIVYSYPGEVVNTAPIGKFTMQPRKTVDIQIGVGGK